MLCTIANYAPIISCRLEHHHALYITCIWTLIRVHVASGKDSSFMEAQMDITPTHQVVYHCLRPGRSCDVIVHVAKDL